MKKTSKGGHTVMFQMAAEPGMEVYLAGTFNAWNPTANPMRHNPANGHYQAALRLPPGRHEYKFVVGGEWRLDPACPDSVPNDQGSLNSVITV